MSNHIMNPKYVSWAIFSILLLFSCNTRNKNISKDIFKITLVAKVMEDDKFQVFFIDEINKGYTDDKRIVVNVKQSLDFQEITFQLNSIPLTFRIDLGEKGYNSLVAIDKVILKNGSKRIELDNNVLHRFFEANIYISKIGSEYHRSTVEGRYDPFISATALLEKKLELEF
ncbi:MAG: hypothetical protein RIB64_02910 [Arenibacter algicola]